MRKKPGMESIYLMQTATGIGVRETRRIIREYVITEQDAIKGKRFQDVVAISSNPMPEYRGKRFFFEHDGFDIPYRSLVPKKVQNLLLTGRCISSEQGGAIPICSVDASSYGYWSCIRFCSSIGCCTKSSSM